MNRYRNYFDCLPQPAIILDSEMRVEKMNKAAVDIFRTCRDGRGIGLSREQLSEWLQSEILGKTREANRFAFSEKDLDMGDGTPRYFRVRLAQVDEGNENKATVALLTDITERRRFLEELGRLASIVNSSEDAIIAMRPDGTILNANHSTSEMYGMEDVEIEGKSIFLLIPDGYRAETEQILSKVSTGQAVKRHESWRRRLDGTIFPISATYSPIECYGKIIGISAIVRDITSRKHSEQALKTSHRQIVELLDETVKSLSMTLEIRDLYTAGHQQRVAAITDMLAERMSIDSQWREGIRISALLHDIGKISIPMAILSKPGKLQEYEMNNVRTHPQTGFQILSNIPFPWPVGEMILQHHERIDGSGYPNGVTGYDMHIGAKILGVADVLEAMSSHRPYRPALGMETAVKEILGHSGRLYDQAVCEALEELVGTGSISHTEGGITLCKPEAN